MKLAYSELYTRNAREVVGCIFYFAIKDLKLAPNWAAKLFTYSKISKEIEIGNPSFLSALTKEECAYFCLVEHYPDFKRPPYRINITESKEFWAGSTLALLQHQLNLSFKEILEHISFRELLNIYDEFEKMERIAIVEEISNRYFNKIEDITKLKKLRMASGFSQSELAEKSGVALRMIQLYEQRVNNIDSAQANTLYKLSIALDCEIKDLLENKY